MISGSRYGRPVTPADITDISTALAAVQRSIIIWHDTHQQPLDADPAGVDLCDNAEILCDIVQTIMQDCLAPAANGLYIIR